MTTKLKAKISIEFILLFIFFTSAVVFGQDSEYEITNDIKQERILGKHYFTPNNTIQSPFILTYLRTVLGVGQINDLLFPLIKVGNKELLVVQGDIFVALLNLEYQHALKNWLAAYIQFGLIGRLGSDTGTLVTQGVNYASTFDIGWLIKVFRADKFALSTTVEVSNGKYSFISIQNFVNNIINDDQLTSLVTFNNSLYGVLGIRAAYGFNHFLGLNFVANLGYGETIQRNLENRWFTILGINADINLTKLIKSPISLSLGYLYSTYPKNNNDVLFNNHIIITQLNYIGRPNIVVSLEYSYSRELGGDNENVIWLNTLRFKTQYLF